jgi:hypothetical protein
VPCAAAALSKIGSGCHEVGPRRWTDHPQLSPNETLYAKSRRRFPDRAIRVS